LAIFLAIAALQARIGIGPFFGVRSARACSNGAYLIGGAIRLVAGMFIAIASLCYRPLKTTLMTAVAANFLCYTLASFAHSAPLRHFRSAHY
jgi:hypothetical protein